MKCWSNHQLCFANQCEVNALARLGVNIPLEEYMDISLGKHNRQVTGILKEKFGINLSADFWQEVALEQKKIFEQELRPVEGIVQVIESMSFPKCIASGSSPSRLHLTLKITGLHSHFEGYIFSAEHVARGKPFPDIFLYAADQMQANPQNCIVIEDSLAGIEGALAAGMTVLAFGGGQHITSRMRQNLKESKAHVYFERMSELNEILDEVKRG